MKCPHCHKEIEVQIFKPEEVFEPKPTLRIYKNVKDVIKD
jgi:hypothetical protein